jgi:hypothetical protein
MNPMSTVTKCWNWGFEKLERKLSAYWRKVVSRHMIGIGMVPGLLKGWVNLKDGPGSHVFQVSIKLVHENCKHRDIDSAP